jgi:hypothetical protein
MKIINFWNLQKFNKLKDNLHGHRRQHTGKTLASPPQGQGFESSHHCWHRYRVSGKKSYLHGRGLMHFCQEKCQR